MTEYVWTNPTARTRHRCYLCRRCILPGEAYWRMAGLDRGKAWTSKNCWHCYRVSTVWARIWGDDEWCDEALVEWLRDEYPALYAAFLANWRYPDGELLPLPFTPACCTCGTAIPDSHLWCQPCDQKRIERIGAQLESIRMGGSNQ